MSARFNLERPPFSGDGPDGCFFPTRDLNQRLDLIHHLIQFSDLTLIVSGPRGVGKTTFLGELVATARERWRACIVDGSPELTPERLIERLVAGFDLPARQDADPLACLEAHLESLHRARQLAVICVDDAHRLPPGTQSFVLELVERWEGSKARILLIKDSDAPGTAFDATERLEGLVHRMELVPFDEEQTGDYIHLRLTRAGLEGDSPFTPRVIRTIFNNSGGVAGTINTLAQRVIDNHRSRRAGPTGRGRRVALAAAAVLLAGSLGIGVFTWLAPDAGPPDGPDAAVTPFPPAPPSETPATRRAGLEEPTADATGDDAPAPAPPAETAGPPAPGPAPAPPAETAGLPAPGPAPVPPAETAGTPAPGPAPAPPAETAGTPAPGPAPAPPAETAGLPAPGPAPVPPAETAGLPAPGPAPAPPAETAGPPAPGPAPVPPAETAGTPPARPAAVPLPKPIPASPDEPALAEPAPASRDEPAPAPLGDLDMRGIDWLRSRGRAAYTIQLVGSHEPQSVVEFIRRHALGEKAAWFATRHAGKPWYVVVIGAYPSIAAARAAIAELPAELRRQQPWARSIGGIVDTAVR